MHPDYKCGEPDRITHQRTGFVVFQVLVIGQQRPQIGAAKLRVDPTSVEQELPEIVLAVTCRQVCREVEGEIGAKRRITLILAPAFVGQALVAWIYADYIGTGAIGLRD